MIALSVALVLVALIAWDAYRRYLRTLTLKATEQSENATKINTESIEQLQKQLNEVHSTLAMSNTFRKR